MENNTPKHNSFYDIESAVYSKKRYEGKSLTYVQSFFKRRLTLVLRLLSTVVSENKNLSLLDIGCADGVITRSIQNRFATSFSELVGVDVSIPMIEMARKLTKDENISYFSKEETPDKKFDIVMSLGYLSAVIYDDEFKYVSSHLKPGGYYICSLTSKDSLHRRLKLGNVSYLSDFRTYKQYREMLSEHFQILAELPYGFFVPKLWAIPAIGRILQPLFETIFAPLTPDLFHEKVYLLKLK